MQHKNKTVVKSMEILSLFQKHAKLSLQEIVKHSGLPKTSVHRMVGSLEDMGFLTRDTEGRYALGLLFLQYGQLVKERLDPRGIALPVMRRLRDDVGEAVNLIIADRYDAIYVEKVETIHPVRVYTQIGRRAPMHAGACPRVLLAFLPEEEQQQYLASADLKPIAKGTLTDAAALQQALEETRRNGYSVSHSELEDNTAAVAAPIFDYKGRVVAGLSIAGHEANYGAEQVPRLAEQVMRAAGEISAKLGFER